MGMQAQTRTRILIFGWHGEPLDTVRVWVAPAWSEVVGSDDTRHAVAGTRVERVEHPGKFITYVSKPADPGTPPHPGKPWGKFRADRLPWAPAVTLELTPAEADEARRRMLAIEQASAPASREPRAKTNPTRHTITAGNAFLESILRERATGKPDDTPPAARYLGPAGKGDHPHNPAPGPPAQAGEVAPPRE